MKKLLVIAAMSVAVSANSQNVHIPNAFTPDGDGKNDYWKPMFNDTLSISDYLLEVYSRSGHLIFETRDSNQYWDGTYNWGVDAKESTYVYRLVARIDNNDVRGEGVLHIVR